MVLDSNELTGEIPIELTRLTNLLSLYLADNDLSGCVPTELRAVYINDLDFLEIPFCDLVLSSLTVSPGELEPPFDPYHARYSVTVDTPQITVAATSDHNADFQFFGRFFGPIPETDGHQIDLSPGLNRIFLEVTSPDGEGDPLFYTLGGPDARSFEIDDATGQIQIGQGTMLDYESRRAYMVEVTAADGNGNSAAADVAIMVTDMDLGTPYDRDNNEVIDREEAVAAVVDYFGGLITKNDEAVSVIVLYLTGGQGRQATGGIPGSARMTKEGGMGMMQGEEDDALTSYMKQRVGSNETPDDVHFGKF